MLANVQTAWLFTRGWQSVRIIRVARRDGGVHLLVHGPGDAAEDRSFDDVVACMNYQADLERRLVAQGFTLERFTSDRRVGTQQRRTPESERRRE